MKTLFVVLSVVVLSLVLSSNLVAQDIFSVSAKAGAEYSRLIYLDGAELSKAKADESTTLQFSLTPGKTYVLSFEGTGCTFEYEGVVFEGDFENITITATTKATKVVYVRANTKKANGAAVISLLQ